jgi:hypothetical protein
MAYEFDLETELPAPFRDNLGTAIIEFALGYDTDANQAIIMSVMLVPIRGTHDIRFGLRERDLDHEWKITGADYSIAKVRRYIPKDKRDTVCNLLLDSIKELITHVKPKKVTMETAFANLPDVAMIKYKYIANTVNNSGLATSDEFKNGDNGKYYWLFSLPD